MNELRYYEFLKPFKRTGPEGLTVPAGVYVRERNKASSYSLRLTQHAERVWSETEYGVRYVKDRVSTYRLVDLEEFLWIKLKAQTIRERL